MLSIITGPFVCEKCHCAFERYEDGHEERLTKPGRIAEAMKNPTNICSSCAINMAHRKQHQV